MRHSPCTENRLVYFIIKTGNPAQQPPPPAGVLTLSIIEGGNETVGKAGARRGVPAGRGVLLPAVASIPAVLPLVSPRCALARPVAANVPDPLARNFDHNQRSQLAHRLDKGCLCQLALRATPFVGKHACLVYAGLTQRGE